MMTRDDGFYRRLVQTGPFGYACYQQVLAAEAAAVDYECVEINPAFEQITGIAASDIVGRRTSTIAPAPIIADHDWLALFDGVTVDGGGKVFMQYSTGLKRWYTVQVYSPETNYFLTIYVGHSEEVSRSAEHTDAEESLMTERNLLLTLINSIPDRIYVKDKECRFVLNNTAHLNSLGVHSQSEVVGKSDRDLRSWEHSSGYQSDDRRVIEIGEAIYNKEEPTIDQSGEYGMMLTSKTPFRDTKGEVIGLVGVSRDITSRKRIEDELKKSEARFKTVSRLSSDFSYSIVQVGVNGFMDEWITDAFYTLTGYSEHDLRLEHCWLFAVHPEDRSRVVRQFNALREGDSLEHEFRLRAKNGSVVWINNKIERSAVTASSTGTGRIYGAVKNITERKLREQVLLESEERHRIVLQTAMDGYWLADFSGHLLEVNDAYSRMSGYSVQELLTMSIPDLESAESAADTAEHIRRIMADGEDRFITRHRRKDGRIYDVEASVIYKPIDGGRFICFLRDVTERKQAENKFLQIGRLYAILGQINKSIVRLREQDELFAALCTVAIEYGQFRMAWVGLIDDQTGRIVPVTHAGHEDGYLASAALSTGELPTGEGPTGSAVRQERIMTSNDIASEPHLLPWRNEALKRGYRSSASVPIHRRGVPVGAFTLYASEPGFFTADERKLLEEIGEDVSFALDAMASEKEQLHAREAFRENEKMLRTLIMRAPVGIAIARDGVTLDANPAYLTMFGYSSLHEIYNTPLLNQIAPQEREVVISKIQLRALGENVESSYKTMGLRKDGSQFPFLVSVVRIQLSEGPLSFSFFTDLSNRP
jgi:PAS domain S-box-containing protein